MCRCCSVVLDNTVYLLDPDRDDPPQTNLTDPIRITFYLDDGSKVMAFEMKPRIDHVPILGSTAHQLTLVADDPVLGWTSTPVTPGKKI